MQDVLARVTANPKFLEFVAKRNRYGAIMTILSAAIYYGFILLVAFDPQLLAQKMSPGAVTSIGVPIGVGVIVATIIITWIYVSRANGEFDETNAQLIREAQK